VNASNDTDVLAPPSTLNVFDATCRPPASSFTGWLVTAVSDRLVMPAVTVTRSWLANRERCSDTAVTLRFGRSAVP